MFTLEDSDISYIINQLFINETAILLENASKLNGDSIESISSEWTIKEY